MHRKSILQLYYRSSQKKCQQNGNAAENTDEWLFHIKSAQNYSGNVRTAGKRHKAGPAEQPPPAPGV